MPAKTLKKTSQGYGYRYTDLAEIHNYLEETGCSYYQEIDSTELGDYVVTTVLDPEGKETRKVRGAKVVTANLDGKQNPAQQMGAALTYARRYSLLMAFGLATEDDDAATLTAPPAPRSDAYQGSNYSYPPSQQTAIPATPESVQGRPVTVESVERKDGAKGPFLRVKLEGIGFASVFDEPLFPLFHDGAVLSVTTKKVGSYTNVVSAEAA